jgi:hypothetical protein
MTNERPTRRWYHLTPDHFFIAMFVVQAFLLLSKRFQWFAFNQQTPASSATNQAWNLEVLSLAFQVCQQNLPIIGVLRSGAGDLLSGLRVGFLVRRVLPGEVHLGLLALFGEPMGKVGLIGRADFLDVWPV